MRQATAVNSSSNNDFRQPGGPRKGNSEVTFATRTRKREGGEPRQRRKVDSIKRVLDLLIASAAIVLTLPLMLLVALLIKSDSVGPVLYRQQRIGLRGRVFVLYKFRSIRHDAEADWIPIWAAKRDPRITRIGRFAARVSTNCPSFLMFFAGT